MRRGEVVEAAEGRWSVPAESGSRVAVKSGGRAGMLAVLVLAIALGGLPALPAEAVTPCSRGTVALTFDDGPHGTYTPRVLDVLEGRRVKATFFQVGTRVSAHPRLTRRVHAAGHRVANHTWRHENLTRLSSGAIRDTLRRTNRRIRDAGAANPTLVRPPYGATNSRVRGAINDLGMTQVLWNIDPQDWRSGRSAATIRRLTLANLRDGGNVVLHDGVANSRNTVAALPGIIDGARSRGYCLGNLDARGRVRPPVPAARIGNAQVREGAAGTRTTAYLTVTLSEPTSRKVSFAYTTVNGRATAGSDYVATSGTLTFAVGQTSKRIAVKVKGDALDEFDEKFKVRLSKPAGATLARSTGKVTIVDDDPAPTVSVGDASVQEGAAGTTTALEVPVRLSAPSGKTITVDYATADGTATGGADYRATSGTLTFKPGQTRKTVTATVIGDALDEPNETFTVRLRNPRRTSIARGTGTVTIVDDDPAPTVSVDDASVGEGAAGTSTTVAVRVRLSAASGRTVTVGYATADGTATAGSDYLAASGTVTFKPGQTSTTVVITVLGDDEHEGDETFSLALTSPNNTSVARGSAIVTIVDDDPPPSPEGDGSPLQGPDEDSPET